MKNRKNTIAIILVSIFLGLILSIQLKTVNQTVGGILPTQRSQQLAAELKKLQSEKDSQTDHIEELEKKIEQYEQNEVDKNVYAENIYNDTVKYKMLGGYTDLEGQGIVLKIEDPPEDIQYGEGYGIVDELDLILQTISILNAADAEAISINDQRYTSYTEIVRAGDHIEINGVSTSAPIIIKAIGDPDILESALGIKHGIVWQLRHYDYLVNLRQDKNINIPKYRNVKDFIYGDPIEEISN
ncbi:MAG TPA: DUF881 domain-containing protein [Tissierellaceae bacterium]|nr:DUF881 domain-containing protein [Tissierellaceae bacterium]